MPAGHELLLRNPNVMRQGNLNLRLDQIDPEDTLRYGVFHLNARVHLHKEETPVLRQQEFHRTRVLVPDAAGNLHRGLLHCRARRVADVRGGRFLEQLLVLSLQGAFARAEVEHVSVHVRQNLHLNVSCVGQVRFQINAAVAKRQLRLAAHQRILSLERGRVLDDADSLSAAAARRLDHQRKANCLGDDERFLQAVHRTVRTGNDGKAVCSHRLSRHLLVAKQQHGLRRGSDEANSRLRAG
ncbi:hypothetical protein SDC9_131019 [bioreactor metagenome]|uniref:Uncharacterized protein n=1 Tax=bioreactor metagenome TaxID=1076179 RepID=A0A645D419_9ZZZZ